VTQQVLDRSLLSRSGCILVDNGMLIQPIDSTYKADSVKLVFARGFAVSQEETANIDTNDIPHWVEAGELVRQFNSFVAGDPRVHVTMLPFFDGLSEIRWNNQDE
jgi:hypothetical protein